MAKFLLTRAEWDQVKSIHPESTKPEDVGVMLYWSPERLDLLNRLNERWKSTKKRETNG